MPLRPRLLVPSLLAALVLTGCSSTVDGRATTAAQGDDAGASTLTEADLEAMLLTADDLPPGYETLPPDDDSDDGATTYEPEECSAIFSDTDDAEPLAEVEAGLVSTDGTQVVQHQAVLLEGEAATDLEDVDAALQDCTAFTETEADGTTTAYTVEPLRLGGFGDRTVALRLTAESDGRTLLFDAVGVAVGSVGLFYVVGGIDYLDTDELGTLVDLGVQRALEAGA